MVVMPLSLSASMTSWKPSVNSRSAWAAGSAVFIAASAIETSLMPFLYLLAEIVSVLGHVLGEPQRVIAHQSLGPAGIARLDRPNDVHVVADRAVRAVAFADGLAADHPHVGEQILSKVDQHAIAAHADDGLVEFDVDLRVFVEVGVQA